MHTNLLIPLSTQIWLSTACIELAVLEHPESVITCCFSPSGFYVATGCTDSVIRIWNGTLSLSYTCVVQLPMHNSSPRILFASFLSGIPSVFFCDLCLILQGTNDLLLSELSILCVTDTEVLKIEWNYPSNNYERDNTPVQFHSSTKQIACANKNYCFQCTALADNQQLLAIATSKDNILLYNIETAQQVFEYVGHTGSVS